MDMEVEGTSRRKPGFIQAVDEDRQTVATSFRQAAIGY
jgi:hypothetical protein